MDQGEHCHIHQDTLRGNYFETMPNSLPWSNVEIHEQKNSVPET